MALHTGVRRGARRRLLRPAGQPRRPPAGGRAWRAGAAVAGRPPSCGRTDLPADVALRDLGEHRLRTCAARARLPARRRRTWRPTSRPLRTLDAPPNNLPLQLTSFVGREREIARGAGGCSVDAGSSRSPAPAARARRGWRSRSRPTCWTTIPTACGSSDLAPRYRSGPRAADRRRRPRARGADRAAVVDALVEYLCVAELLLVLDNCEHLVAPARSWPTRCCPAAARGAVLATQPRALRFAGEIIYPVPPLTAPGRSTRRDIGARAQYVGRACSSTARGGPAGFAVDRPTRRRSPDLLAAGRHPAGHRARRRPAARALRSERSPARRSLPAPHRGGRTALPRQQTLRAPIDWSYDLLHAERRVFESWRCSPVVGPWSPRNRPARGTPVVRRGTGHPHRAGRQEPRGRRGARRHHPLPVLETVRQHARERLRERGEDAQRQRAAPGDFLAWPRRRNRS